MEQLRDLDNTVFADYINKELRQNFDRLDLRRNYSLLVVPGYLGSNAILDKWSKMAYENKAFLITDFQDLESPDDVIDIFFNADHTSGDAFKSNTVMTCNWLLGRAKRIPLEKKRIFMFRHQLHLPENLWYLDVSGCCWQEIRRT